MAGVPQRPIRPCRRATAGKQGLAGPIAVADCGVKSNPLAAGGVACHGIREQSDYESAVRNTSSLPVFYSAASRTGDAHRFR